MKTIDIIKQAASELHRNRMRAFFMMLGIIIGIAMLTMIVAAGAGARRQVVEKVRSHGLDTIVIRPGAGKQSTAPGPDRTQVSLTTADAAAIRMHIPQVKHALPVQIQSGLEVKHSNHSFLTRVFGVTPEWAGVRGWQVERGEFIRAEDVARSAKVCVIGQTVWWELFGGGNAIGQVIRIGQNPFVVQGIFKTKGASLAGGDRDNRIVIPFSTAARRLFNQIHLDQIVVQVDDAAEIEIVAAEVKALLRERHQLIPPKPDDFRLQLPKAMIAQATAISQTFSTLLVLLACISLLVGGIVIANLMLIAVNERKYEIGLRRAIGARTQDIFVQFLSEALLVTLCGGCVGFFIGLLGVEIMVHLAHTPAAISWEAFALALGFSFVVGILASVQPARQSAALDPVEALRS